MYSEIIDKLNVMFHQSSLNFGILCFVILFLFIMMVGTAISPEPGPLAKVGVLIFVFCLSFFILSKFCSLRGVRLDYKFVSSNEFIITNSDYIKLNKDIREKCKNASNPVSFKIFIKNKENNLIPKEVVIDTYYLKDISKNDNKDKKIIIDEFKTNTNNKYISFKEELSVVKEIK